MLSIYNKAVITLIKKILLILLNTTLGLANINIISKDRLLYLKSNRPSSRILSKLSIKLEF
jgi:hypothetical protein